MCYGRDRRDRGGPGRLSIDTASHYRQLFWHSGTARDNGLHFCIAPAGQVGRDLVVGCGSGGGGGVVVVVVGWWAGWRVVITVAVDLVVCSSSLSRCWYF